MTKYAFSVKEASAALGVSPGLVRKMIRAGTLASLRMGRRLLIPAASIEALGGYNSKKPVAAGSN